MRERDRERTYSSIVAERLPMYKRLSESGVLGFVDAICVERREKSKGKGKVRLNPFTFESASGVSYTVSSSL